MKAVNLIPAEQRAGGTGAGESEGAAYIVLGVVAGLAILALLYGLARHDVSSRVHEAATLSAEAQAVQARANELAPYTRFETMATQRKQTAEQLIGTRFDWAHALHELGRVLPSDAALSTVSGTIGGKPGSGASATPPATAGTVSSATPPGSTPTLTLAGCATSQSEVAQTLQRLRLIDGVSEVELLSSTKTETGGGGSSSAGGSAGGCPAHDPAFTVQVLFSGLPTPPGTSSSTTTTASTTAGAP